MCAYLKSAEFNQVSLCNSYFFPLFKKGDDRYKNQVNCDIAAVMFTRERMHALKCQTSVLMNPFFISVFYECVVLNWDTIRDVVLNVMCLNHWY